MFKFLIVGVLFRLIWTAITFVASLAHSVVAKVVGAHVALFGNLFSTEPNPFSRKTTRRF